MSVSADANAVDDRSRFRKTKNEPGRECLVASIHRRFSSLRVEEDDIQEGQPNGFLIRWTISMELTAELP